MYTIMLRCDYCDLTVACSQCHGSFVGSVLYLLRVHIHHFAWCMMGLVTAVKALGVHLVLQVKSIIQLFLLHYISLHSFV